MKNILKKTKYSVLILISILFLIFPGISFASTPPDLSDYTINSIPEKFIDISATGYNLSLSTHQSISTIPLEFDFLFYDFFYSNITIASNGYITFSNQTSDENAPFPSADPPDNMIAPFRDSLDPGLNPESGIYIATTGSPPYRQCIVQWDNISLADDPGSSLTFEVILFESSNEIQFHYLSMTDSRGEEGTGPVSGSSASIGIENSDGTRGTEISYKQEGIVRGNTAFSLTQGGNAFRQGLLPGDLNNDKAITILDQSLLTDVIVGENTPAASTDLLLADIAPAQGTGGRGFGDGKIDGLDHQRLFQVIMGRGTLNPVLSGSSLQSALPGETLRLYGSGFSAISNQNSVIFTNINDVAASALPSTINPECTELSVTIPSGLDFITSVRVEKNGLMSNSLSFFLENSPVITRLSPAVGEAGDIIRIKGYEFGFAPEDNIVRFNGVQTPVLSSTSENTIDELIAAVPPGVTTGMVTVTANTHTSNGVLFTVDGPPVIEIISPNPGSEISSPTEIIGTATDMTLLEYTLEYAPAGETDFITIGTGENSVVNGVIGNLDPTMLLNGLYTLRLTATDEDGYVSSITETFLIKGDMKIGNFSITFQDLSIPVSGLPMIINRSYDSRDKGSHDFGYGWNIDILTTKVEENSILGEGWIQKSDGFLIPLFYLSPLKEKYVTITLPNGNMEEFDVAINPEYSALIPYSTPAVSFSLKFIPREGTTSSLRIATNQSLLFAEPNIINSATNAPYDPDRYILTTIDGSEYLIDEYLGLLSMTEPNGNTLTINTDGIIHSSGKSISFTRDEADRITRITDPMGNTLQYGYDAAGDLASFTDQLGNITRYTYNLSHGLLDIIDPLGRRAIRNEYDDDGRVIAHIDADGNRIEFSRDIDARQEIITNRLGQITVYNYDTNGLILSATDSLGNSISYTYDENKNKTSETDPLGRTTTYTYDSNNKKLSETIISDGQEVSIFRTYDDQGRILSSTDPSGYMKTYTYDDKGNLTSLTDSMGNTTSSTYDSSGNISSVTNNAGNTTTYEYDLFGNLIKKIYPDGNVITYTYDVNGNMLTLTDGSGNTTSYTYDLSNRLISIRDASGITSITEYDAAGNVIAKTDALGNRTTYTYNPANKVLTTTYPDNTITTNTYDAEGNCLSTTDQSGRTTTFSYNNNNWPFQITYPHGGTLQYEYDALGRQIGITDALGNTYFTEYDDLDNVASRTDPLGNTFTYTYDLNGNIVSQTDANNNTTSYTYNANNLLIRTTYSDGTFTENTYDTFGNRTAVRDQAGNTTSIVYDITGHPVQIIQEEGGIQLTTEYSYDAVGNLILQKDAKGNETHFEYNHRGHETARILPDGSRETKVYDSADNLIQKTDFMGRTTHYTYDSMNRLLSKTYPDGSGVTYTYTNTGNTQTAADAQGVTTYTYDDMDRITGIINPDGTTLTYSYDLKGNRLALSCTLPGEDPITTSYTYDAIDRLSGVTDPGSHNYTYTYDNNGNRSSLTLPNNTRTTYTYDTLNRLTNLSTTLVPTSTSIQSYAFTPGPSGNHTQVVENQGLSRERIIHYTYDSLYRLTGETVHQPDNTLVYEKFFSYDTVGNRRQQITTAGISAPSAIINNSITYTYDSRDRLINEGGQTYTWDENGNLISKAGEATYTWDYENRLIRFESVNGTVSDYVYDVDGNRVQTTTTLPGQQPVTTNYIVDSASSLPSVIADTDETGTLLAYYVRGVDLLAVLRPDTSGWQTRFYHIDGTNSVRVLTDENGVITDTYTYTAFGELIDHSYIGAAPDPQPFAFNGEPLDPNSHFQYHRARWMDPSVGRFTAMDLLRGNIHDPKTLHIYAFAGNNPVIYFDPSGLITKRLLGTRIHQDIIKKYPGPTLGGKMIKGYFRRLFPDIADPADEIVIEIKPATPYGVATGYVQLALYIKALNLVGAKFPNIKINGHSIGTNWKPGSWEPPGTPGAFTVTIATVPYPYVVIKNISGVLFYSTLDLETALAALAALSKAIEDAIKKFDKEILKPTQQQAGDLVYTYGPVALGASIVALGIGIFYYSIPAIIAAIPTMFAVRTAYAAMTQ